MLEKTLDQIMEINLSIRGPLETAFDPEWRSPCEIGEPEIREDENPIINWEPVKRNSFADDFAGLERAIERPIHPDVKTYYSRYWSANLPMQAPDGYLELLFLWNEPDVTRLTENLIGHYLACKQNKNQFSVFFACTEPDSDYFLTINNESGVIQLELPGQKPIRELSANLNEFLSTLTID